MSYWLKLYTEIIDDLKVAKLSDFQFRLFVLCLLYAKELDEDGKLAPASDIAWRLRLPDKSVEEALRAMRAVGIVDEHERCWFVVNFAKRQYSESYERVKRYRKKRECNAVCNGSETTRVEEEVEVEKEEEEEAEVEKKESNGAQTAPENLLATTATPTNIQNNWDELKKWGVVENEKTRKIAEDPTVTPEVIQANATRLTEERRFTTGLLITALQCGDHPPPKARLGQPKDPAKYAEWEQ